MSDDGASGISAKVANRPQGRLVDLPWCWKLLEIQQGFSASREILRRGGPAGIGKVPHEIANAGHCALRSRFAKMALMHHRGYPAISIAGAALSWLLPVVLAKPFSMMPAETSDFLFWTSMAAAIVLEVFSCLALPVQSVSVRTAAAAVCGLGTAPLALTALLFFSCTFYGDCLPGVPPL